MTRPSEKSGEWGINAWAADHPAELSAAAQSVLSEMGPIQAEHVYAHCLRIIHYDWIVNPTKVRTRCSRAVQPPKGSNEWVIAPSRSASGNTMLLSNSHLQWGDRHTYMEVQLDAPGVTSYGAVWIGFPVLRQCFNDHLGWTQTTNNPCLSDLYALTLDGDGYVLDGETLPFESHTETIKVLQDDGSVEEVELPVRRSVHGPVVAEPKSAADDAATVAMKVAAIDRPGLFEQFWKMGLASSMAEWEDAMRMQQLPIFNTAYADGDGHIAYGPLNYRTAARTPFLRPYLAHFCSSFRHFFAVFSVLTPGFQKVAPRDRGPAA